MESSVRTLTPEQIKERRKYFLNKSLSKTKNLRGSRGVGGTRFCVVCHIPLTTVILPTGKPQTIRDHYRCKMNDLITVSLCADSRVCQREHRKRRGAHVE